MKKRILFLLAIFFAWLPVFIIQKPAFMLYNHALAAGSSFIDYLMVILHGLKLDLTVAGYLTCIPLLLILASAWLPGDWLKKTLKIYFIMAAVIISAIFAVDVALYSYWGFRLDATLFFYLKSPADAMASVPIGKAIVQIIVFLLYAFLISIWFIRIILPLAPEKLPMNRILSSIVILLLGGGMFIPIRGGVTTSTANVGMVYFSDRQFLNHSAINPCFSLLSSLSKEERFADQFNFFPEAQRKAIFDPLFASADTCSRDTLLNTTRPNVLIIILESFSANTVEAVGGEPGITPNLNRLSKEGVLFTNIYANSFRTDRGLVSVLNGYLAQPTTSIMKYPSKSQSLPSIAKSLDELGYTSDMLYGGDINFTNMKSYFFSSGYSKITSDVNFPIGSRLNKWGANDNYTFNHLYEVIKDRQNGGNWMSTFLTLSSHEPFEVPFHHLKHPYLNSVAFTDSCIGQFVNKVRQLPQWKNLLIVFIADHGYHYPESLTDFEPRRFHIPMLWIGGAVKNPRVIDTFGNQTDLAATLLHQMNVSASSFRFSKDLLDPCVHHFAFYTYPNLFGFIDAAGVSAYDNESNKTLLSNPSQGDADRISKGKAILQTLYDDMGNR